MLIVGNTRLFNCIKLHFSLLTIQPSAEKVFHHVVFSSQSQIHPPSQAASWWIRHEQSVHTLTNARPCIRVTLESDIKSVKSGTVFMVIQGSRGHF